MTRIMAVFVRLVWALWLGGLVGMFVGVQALFAALPRGEAGAAASTLFVMFGRYQLMLAALALLGTFYFRWRAPSRATLWLFVVLAVTIVIAVIVAGWVIPTMNALRLAQRTTEPLFIRLHGWSMGLMLAEAVLLAGAGFLLPPEAVPPKAAAP